ncbi:TadE/TadG family type IV pilus assembly protein [Vibrio harveyi]|uniref:TadE/TadG family type IV pilus assembly protein n=1 Tax=Vibrio harveyi TaxID=669 RepID=UPI00237F2416|nr:TadE/TadG family type IV pilus assembly protein [Vibrio harveyi]HDM8072426.1 pilus assembly protein [Vibrio harveyi]
MRMQQYQHRSLQQQKGVAAVWMGLLLVPIMGVTFWAVEGTRYVQESSRLRDSAEAAAMAVTIEDQPGAARALATKYVENYVRDIKSTNLSAQRFYQAEDKDTGALEYIQYTVNARTTHDSWFASSFIPSFDKQQELAGRSLARKYPAYLGDNNIDIVFVSDFSGSMNDKWGSSRSKKIDDLKTAIEQISNKILCKKIRQDFVDGEWKDVCDEPGEDTTGDKLLNRVGFVPFNVRTREIVAGNRANATSQLSYKNGYKAYLSPYSYNDIDWDYWRMYSASEVYNCAYRQSYCQSPRSENQNYAKRIRDVLEADRYAVADVYNYVDLPTSVSTMFTDKSGLKPNFYGVSGTRLFNAHGSSNSSQFYNIQLSNKLSDLDSIKSMWADGGTAAFQGILRGSQVLHDGDPNSTDEEEQQAYNKKIKMLLILSDGQESPNNGILKGLVDNGMCDKARAEIPGLYIGVIGIDFRASQQSGFQDCVVNPSEDIIDVSNLDELIEKIEELIRKGSKTSGITKLY